MPGLTVPFETTKRGMGMKIIADAFGGDNAPLAVLKGCEMAVKEYGIEIILAGNEQEIQKCAEENAIDLSGMEILHADEVFSMHDNPKDIIKSKSNTSMAVGLKALADGMGDAFISAGSTGALVMGSTFIVKRIKGVKRAAFGSALPTKNGKYVFLMDEGANADCRPEMLLQFAVMASCYVENVMGVENPTVGLLNIGTEDSKGGELQLEAYKLLKGSSLNFIGNIEARELMSGDCDVIIADGFSGNIALKTTEGVVSLLMGMIKDVFKTNIITKIAAMLVLPYMKSIKEKLDYKKIGGAPVIGVKKPVFKAHGNSDAEAFKSALKLAKSSVESNFVEKLENNLKTAEKTEEE